MLFPNTKILFDPQGIDTYAPSFTIPHFVWSEANLASALGTEFTFQDTVLHEGNCGPSAFESALNGPGAYTGESEKSKAEVQTPEFRKKAVEFVRDNRALLSEMYRPWVDSFIATYNDPNQTDLTNPLIWFCKARFDVSAFREEIVKYAAAHRSELIQKYGEESVEEVITTYNDPTKMDPETIMYTGYIVWECAANLYGHTINLYSRSGVAFNPQHQTRPTFFELDEHGNVKPIATFAPEGKEPLPPPLNLMLFGPHYCTLIPK